MWQGPWLASSLSNTTSYANLSRSRFFAIAWKAPQAVDQDYLDRIAKTFEKELQILLVALPGRFHPIIRATLTALPSIYSLPMVLLHKDFGDCNIMVEDETCHLVGVID